jgi:hypothetical protein
MERRTPDVRIARGSFPSTAMDPTLTQFKAGTTAFKVVRDRVPWACLGCLLLPRTWRPLGR